MTDGTPLVQFFPNVAANVIGLLPSAIVVVVTALWMVRRGYRRHRVSRATAAIRKFMEDMQDPGSARTAVEWIGTIGYAAKGVVLAVVGILIIVAAATADPSKSSGLDGGLKTLGSQPYGVFMLAASAAGLACYGGYSMARARYGRF